MEPSCLSLQSQRQAVPVVALQVEVTYCGGIRKARGVVNPQGEGRLRRDRTVVGTETEETVIKLRNAAASLNTECGRHLSAVAQNHLSVGSSGDQHSSEVEAVDVGADVGVLADGREFDDALALAIDFKDDCADGDGCLLGAELDFEGRVGVGHEESLGGRDDKLGEAEEVVEGFGIRVEHCEGELAQLPDCAESQLVGLWD